MLPRNALTPGKGDLSGVRAAGARGDARASAAFPIVFAPFVVQLRGPYKTWDEDGAFVPMRHGPREALVLADGGVFENLTLHAARHRAREIIVVNGGEAVDTSTDFHGGNLVTTAIRSVAIMMGRNTRMAISNFLRDEADGQCGGVVIDNTQVAHDVATMNLPVPSIEPPRQPPPTHPIDNTRFPKLAGAHGYDRTTAFKLAPLSNRSRRVQRPRD